MLGEACILRVRRERSGCKLSSFDDDKVADTLKHSYGTGVEHHTLYQYQLANTQNIVMGFIQTETP